MAKQKYFLGFLILVMLTASIYVMIPGSVRIDIEKTKSTFKVWENGSWVISGVEYVNLFDGSAKMRASERTIENTMFENTSIITRVSKYKNNILVVERYLFDGNTDDVTLFPVQHSIEVIGAYRPERPFILQYEVQKLLYSGKTINGVKSPQSFGHRMNVEWDNGNYYSRILRYSGRNEGKLTVKYRIDSDRFFKNVRLFDPPENITVVLNSPVDNFQSEPNITYNCSSSIVGDELLENISLYTNETGVWAPKETIEILQMMSHYSFEESSGDAIDLKKLNNLTNTGVTFSQIGLIDNSYLYNSGDKSQINSFTLDTTNNQYSWNFWSNSTDTSGILFEYADVGRDNVYSFQYNAGGTFSSSRVGGGAFEDHDIGINPSTYQNVWVMWTIVYDQNDSSMKIYKDSLSVDNYTLIESPTLATGNILTIAGHQSTANFDGKIDEFGFFNKALSNDEIIKSYNSGAGEISAGGTSTTELFNTEINGSTLWSCQSCDTAGDCNFAPSNRTAFLDIAAPIITISFPQNISYTVNVSDFNYSVVESNPDSCWYSVDFGNTNSTPVSSGTNFIDVTSSNGSNTWIVYCNDTIGQENSSNVTFFMDLNPPQIEYASNSDVTNITGNFTDKDFVFINVTVIEDFEKNITFRIYFSNVLNSTDTFTDGTRNITYSNLSEGIYFWNVTICDLADQCNSTDTRIYGVEKTNLSLQLNFSSILSELGSDILVNASNNLGVVCVDVDHPDYGLNFSCDDFSLGFDLIINYFRSITFNDSTIFKTLEFIGTQINTIFFPAHQYDEVDNMSINISGTETSQYPENVQINKSNTTEVDRIFPGFLIGDNIYLNKLNTEVTDISLFYSSLGPQSIEFFMDDGATFNELVFNITGIEFGIDFLDNLDNFSNMDTILTTAQLDLSGAIMPPNSTLTKFIFDDFDDSSVDNDKWSVSPDFSQSTGGGADCKIERHVTEQDGEIRLQAENTHSGSGTNGCGSGTSFIISNNTKLNLFTSENIIIRINATTSVENDNTGCGGSSSVTIGNNDVWESDLLSSSSTSSSEAKITFNLTKFNKTHWIAELDGFEINTIPGFTQTYNWTTNTKTLTNGTDVPLINPFFTPVTYNSFVPLGVLVEDSATPQTCKFSFVNTFVDIVNNSLWNRANGTAISKSIHDSSGDITDATLDATGFTAPNETTSFFLSANNGDNWEPVTLGISHSFTFPGTNLKWRVDFNITDPGFKNLTSRITSVNITTPKGFPSDLTFDFGEDGIIDATFNGELNSTNSPSTISINSTDLSSAFTGFTNFDHLFEVPLRITSSSVGELFLDDFNLTYNPNPIILNSTSIFSYLINSINFVDFPISIESIGGNITVDDIRYNYAGGNDTINVLAHNTDYSQNVSRNVTYYYSRWEYFWIPNGVEWIYFAPGKPDSVNVTPYGQTPTNAILNVTNYGYGGKNATLSVFQNGTSDCVNVTMSLTNSKEDGFLLNESFIQLTNLSYLEAADIYLWADYNCTFDTWHLYEPDYYFRQCVDGGVCSTDLI